MRLPDIRSGVSAWAAAEPLVRRAYLFGSHARGDNRPDSDLDIALLFRVDATVLRQCDGDIYSGRIFTWGDNMETWREALQCRLGVPVDLQAIWRHDTKVRPAVRREGVRLY